MAPPRELRDRIYELCLVVPNHERFIKPEWWKSDPITDENKKYLIRNPKIALDITNGCKTYLLDHPPLLAVPHQVREEADAIYWSRNEWQINIDVRQDNENGCDDIEEDLRTPIQQLQKWISKIGMHRLKHLRDFTLGIETCYRRLRCELEKTIAPKASSSVYSPTSWLCVRVQLRMPRRISPSSCR